MGYYRTEDRSYPELERGIEEDFDINTATELGCPNCGGTMLLVDNGLEEEYFLDGRMERSDRFYCDDCGTFADVTQVYAPTVRRVSVKQDVFEEQS